MTVTVERTVPDPRGGSPTVVRFSVEVDPADLDARGGAGATLVERLRTELDAAVARLVPESGAGPRPDRPLVDLIEAYHPRQPELVDLLRDEGELTAGEHTLLQGHLAAAGASAPTRPAPAGVPIVDRPIAAAPLESDRAPSSPRPVDELLRTFQITTLKQAGAVRARRQISFEEYMALKRHFGTPAT